MEKERKIKLSAAILLSLYALLEFVRGLYFHLNYGYALSYFSYIYILGCGAVIISLIKEFKYKNYILISASIILALIEMHMFAINISYAFDFHYIYGLKLFFYLFEACVWILIAIFLLINNCPRFEQFKSKLSLIEKLAHFSLFLLATAFAVPSICDLFTASYSGGGFDSFLLDFLWFFAIYTVKLSIISASQKEENQEESILFKKENIKLLILPTIFFLASAIMFLILMSPDKYHWRCNTRFEHAFECGDDGCIALFIIACSCLLIGTISLIVCLLSRHEKENATSSNAEIIDEHFVSLGKHICLLLFTFGIWYLIWIYKATKYSNLVKDEQERKPSTALLLYIFVPFYSVYWTYKTAQRIDKIAKTRNVQSDIATLCLVLAIFVPILPPIFMQDKINQAIIILADY